MQYKTNLQFELKSKLIDDIDSQ